MSVYFVIDSFRKLLDTASYETQLQNYIPHKMAFPTTNLYIIRHTMTCDPQLHTLVETLHTLTKCNQNTSRLLQWTEWNISVPA